MIIDLKAKVPESKHFCWWELLSHPSWDCFVFPHNMKVYKNLLYTAKKMDLIRDFFGKPLLPTSVYRLPFYNRVIVKGALQSAHTEGMAFDYVIDGMGCDEVRAALEPRLEQFKLRMERPPNPDEDDWVHNDWRPPGPGGRYFYP